METSTNPSQVEPQEPSKFEVTKPKMGEVPKTMETSTNPSQVEPQEPSKFEVTKPKMGEVMRLNKDTYVAVVGGKQMPAGRA